LIGVVATPLPEEIILAVIGSDVFTETKFAPKLILVVLLPVYTVAKPIISDEED
jgi:hypothetical protein